ncbi:MAG: Stk1 family PASTA domain-containing Ser/Thr kinase, partial [Clostridia bacterium]|nr:Stk1 family PASTA domain-containing Ser/Thr kinase [Clostridia bacterium]
MDKYIGKRLDGRYELNELIGVGGMAYVYKALDRIDNRTVAIKILKDEYLANEEFTRRFKNESKAIAILSHPNIVKVYDVSFGDKMQYIVMEYIDGITLKEYIDGQESFKWKEAVHFTVQILRALQHAHDKGIVHRDIKPQNIMLLPDGTIKVTDFGIARFSRQDIRATRNTDKAIGSVHYISPEQARGEITDEKADIYSVGVMLYEMLTGQLPFEADSAVSVAIMQMQSEAKPPRQVNPAIPEGLEDITVKAMQKEPSKRYQSAAEMLYDFEEFKKNPSIHFEYKYFTDDSPTRYMDTISKVRGTQSENAEPAKVRETEKEKKPFPVIPVLCAVAAAFLLVAIIFVGIVLSKQFTNSSSQIRVPNFVGMTLDEIGQNPEYLEWFSFEPHQEQYSEQAIGTVLEQSLEAGIEVKKGVKTITLTVSKGQKMVKIPNVVGQHRDQVEAALKNEGFVVTYALDVSEEVAKDFVISLLPKEYPEELPYGSDVTMVVSNGTTPVDPVPVPTVVNLSKEQALQQLSAAGFVLNETTDIIYVNDPTVPPETVVQQSVAGGTVVQPGSPIQIKVSTGYQEVELQIPLPDSGITVDLQIFVNGKLSPKNLTGILPNVVKTQKVTFAEKADSYIVTVKIAKTGTNNAEFLDYAQYNINGKTGMIVEEYRKANVLSVYDTTTTTGIVDTSDENVFYD